MAQELFKNKEDKTNHLANKVSNLWVQDSFKKLRELKSVEENGNMHFAVLNCGLQFMTDCYVIDSTKKLTTLKEKQNIPWEGTVNAIYDFSSSNNITSLSVAAGAAKIHFEDLHNPKPRAAAPAAAASVPVVMNVEDKIKQKRIERMQKQKELMHFEDLHNPKSRAAIMKKEGALKWRRRISSSNPKSRAAAQWRRRISSSNNITSLSVAAGAAKIHFEDLHNPKSRAAAQWRRRISSSNNITSLSVAAGAAKIHFEDLHNPKPRAAAAVKKEGQLKRLHGSVEEEEEDLVQVLSPPQPLSITTTTTNPTNDSPMVVASNLTNPNIDYPHKRIDCGVHSSSSDQDAVLFCPKCYCVLCQIPASECIEWKFHCRQQQQ